MFFFSQAAQLLVQVAMMGVVAVGMALIIFRPAVMLTIMLLSRTVANVINTNFESKS